MPLLALRKYRSYVSKKYFYTFGVKSASHPFYILFVSLISICLISYPILLPSSSSSFALNNNTNIDAHLWQHSSHLQSAVTMTNPSFIARQIRISMATTDNSISKELLSTSLSIYQALTVSNKLRDICATTQHRQCIVHSPLPIWDYDQNTVEKDVDIVNTINQHLQDLSKPTGLSLHPYATMGQVSLDEKGNFKSANSIIMTFILKNTTSSQIIWNEILQNTIHQFPTVYTDSLNVEPCLLQFKVITKKEAGYCMYMRVTNTALYFFIIVKVDAYKLLAHKTSYHTSI